MKKEKLDERVMTKLKLIPKQEIDLGPWKAFLGKLKNPSSEINIGLVGKYVELKDAYKSIAESFIHAGAMNETKVNLSWIKAESLSDGDISALEGMHGILVAPGFGERGFEGKINAIRFAREKKIPFLGICLGMQCAVVEFARNVLGLKDATSTEMDANTPDPVISMLEAQKKITQLGGSMRLGAYPCNLKKGTKAYHVYGKSAISERHRHRYEFNNDYLPKYESAGIIASGFNPESGLVEVMELKDHPFFIGVQFHPELKSTVLNPHPLFVNFVGAAIEFSKN